MNYGERGMSLQDISRCLDTEIKLETKYGGILASFPRWYVREDKTFWGEAAAAGKDVPDAMQRLCEVLEGRTMMTIGNPAKDFEVPGTVFIE